MSAPEKDNVAPRHSRHGKQTLLDLTHSQTDILVKNRVVTGPFGILGEWAQLYYSTADHSRSHSLKYKPH